MKHQYLSQLRNDTCYPSFRGFVGVFKGVGYVAAIAVVVMGFVSGNGMAMVIGVAAAVVVVLLVTAIAEGSSMLADIADATLDQASQQIVVHNEPGIDVATSPAGSFMKPTDLADLARS